MRLFYALLAPFLIGRLVLGCNTVSPDECWINTSGGFGGGGTIPIGAGVGATTGDFPADPPRRPLDYGEAPNPCIEAQSPCNEKCLASYEDSAIACSKIENNAQRKTCQDDAYASYRSCHDNCEAQEAQESQCRKRCAEQAEVCEAGCRKIPEDEKDARRQCWEGCNNARAACIRKCKK